jgi:hypothetical protein
MLHFKSFLKEEAEEGSKLKHIHHAEDRPLLHGHSGFEHAHGALMAAHEHMKVGAKSSKVTMKYDGSPAIVFGHHPKTGKFFVASKSAFNKNPKINYTHEDIDKNHGHAPGLAEKLHAALKHLPKVTPKHGVYQGDLMHSKTDLHEMALFEEMLVEAAKKVSFTPNTITYTAHGEQAKKIRKSKVGVVVHTKYHGDDIHSMSAHHHVDHENFKEHPDVYHHGAEHDTSKVNYPEHAQHEFHKHMAAAKAIHDTHGKTMYKHTERHQGEGGHLATYINHTVRHDEVPSPAGLQKHITAHYEKAASKLKTPEKAEAKRAEGAEHVAHIEKHKSSYQNLLTMHHHLQQAKNTLVKHLESHEGGYEHHIAGKKSKPEGFVVNHEHEGKTEPTKLVNRAEFAKQNLLKVRK